MIERLLPPYVACASTREDDAPPGTLYPEEAALVARSVDRRRHEFAAVRACARQAMAALGLPPAPVLRGHRGVPLWPAGTVGSMTHCDGYRAAALAGASDFRSLGIDAEPNAPLPPGVWQAISRPGERRRITPGTAAAGASGTVHWDRLLFSAKESVFKGWFPLTGIELDFEDAEISFHLAPGHTTEGTFTAQLMCSAPGLPGSFDGKWLVDDGFAVTAVTVPNPTPSRRMHPGAES